MTAIDDVLLNKAATIKRCLQRIQEEYRQEPQALKQDFTRQDSVILNLQRACEAAIDMANRYLRLHQAGIPQSARDAFRLLHEQGVIDENLSHSLQAIVGLRNIAVPDYQELNLDILISVLDHHLGDFESYLAAVLGHA